MCWTRIKEATEWLSIVQVVLLQMRLFCFYTDYMNRRHWCTGRATCGATPETTCGATSHHITSRRDEESPMKTWNSCTCSRVRWRWCCCGGLCRRAACFKPFSTVSFNFVKFKAQTQTQIRHCGHKWCKHLVFHANKRAKPDTNTSAVTWQC